MILLVLSCLFSLSKWSDNAVLGIQIPEDGLLSFKELVVKYGQQSEELEVVTEDGYIITLFHITGNDGKPPVLLTHGTLDSADTFVIRGKSSIAIMLAEAGYDVWIGNSRGNKYSRRHKSLSPEKDKHAFWDFSIHEMGKYDLPAFIDFILTKTGKDTLSAIGHSQGNAIYYILGATKPEYNAKISVLIALGPIAYANNFKPHASDIVVLWPTINTVLETFGVEEIMPDHSASSAFTEIICNQGQLGYQLCVMGAGAFVGNDPEEIEPEFFKGAVEHFPSGTSRKTITHLDQIAKSNRFPQYDYGITTNRRLYGTISPPDYNIAKVTMPVALLVGENDNISVLEDVERLNRTLPNVVYYHVMERKKFNHIDFVWGKDIPTFLIPILKDLLQKFS